MTLTAEESNITEYICLCAFLSSNKKVSKSAGRIIDLLRIGGDLPTEILSNYKDDFDVMIEDLSQVDVFQLDPKLGPKTIEKIMRNYRQLKTAYETLKKIRKEIA